MFVHDITKILNVLFGITETAEPNSYLDLDKNKQFPGKTFTCNYNFFKSMFE